MGWLEATYLHQEEVMDAWMDKKDKKDQKKQVVRTYRSIYSVSVVAVCFVCVYVRMYACSYVSICNM